jgi:hypothetical protein
LNKQDSKNKLKDKEVKTDVRLLDDKEMETVIGGAGPGPNSGGVGIGGGTGTINTIIINGGTITAADG